MVEFVWKMLFSLAIGGLIGLEREHSIKESVVGIRSFALLSFLGTIAVLLDSNLPVIGFAGIFFLAIVFYYFKAARFPQAVGITTTLMIPFSFVLGVLVGYDRIFEAGASAIMAAVMLAEKSRVHAAVKTLSRQEVLDGLLLLIIAFVVYPLLPTAPVELMGQKLDLYYFWTVVVVVSFLTYGGHMLVKYFKTKAVAYATIFGGVVSSLAVVSLFAKKIKRDDYSTLRFGFTGATVGSIASDIVLLGALSMPLLYKSFIPLGAILLGFLVLSFFYRRGVSEKAIPVFEEPLSLKFALQFALLYLLVRFVTGYLAANDGVSILAFSFITGLLSTTPVFASMAALYSAGSVSVPQAVWGMLLAVLGSLCAKTVLMLLKIKSGLWPRLLLPIIAAVLLGAVGYWLQLSLGW